MRAGRAAIFLLLGLGLQGCYTRLYTGDDRYRAELDSLAYVMDSASGGDSLRDRVIINRYYDQRSYRGYPYEEWDDPFYDPLLRRRYRYYWEYYYDPFWEYRRPYRYYRPYRRYYPQRPPAPQRPRGDGSPSSPGSPGGDGSSGPDLYNPPPRAPAPSRGRRRDEAPEPSSGRTLNDPEESGDAGDGDPPAAEPPRGGGGRDSTGGSGIPAPGRGRRR